MFGSAKQATGGNPMHLGHDCAPISLRHPAQKHRIILGSHDVQSTMVEF